jgi:hypothetical protein
MVVVGADAGRGCTPVMRDTVGRRRIGRVRQWEQRYESCRYDSSFRWEGGGKVRWLRVQVCRARIDDIHRLHAFLQDEVSSSLPISRQ